MKRLWLICLLLCQAKAAFCADGINDIKTAHRPTVSAVLELTQEEKKWLAEHKGIKLGFDGSLPPYSFINDQGNIDGIAVEIMALLSQRTDAAFEIYPDSDWNTLYRAAAEKKVDVIAAMVSRPDRAKWFNFTNPYITKSLVIVTRQDNTSISNLSDLANKRVAVAKGYRYVEQIGAAFPTAIPVQSDSMLESLKQVEKGKVDAAVLFLGTANYLQAKHQLSRLKIAAFFERNSADESIAVRKDWPILATILQKGLDSLTDEEVEKIFSKWVVRGGVDAPEKNNALFSQKTQGDKAATPSFSAGTETKKAGAAKQKPGGFDNAPNVSLNPSKNALKIGKMIIVAVVGMILFVLWLLLKWKQKESRGQARAKNDAQGSGRNLQSGDHDDMHLTIEPLFEGDEGTEEITEHLGINPSEQAPPLPKSGLESATSVPIALDPYKLPQEKQPDGVSTEQISYHRDEDGNFSYISPSITAMLGYSEADFIANYRSYLTQNPVNRRFDEFIEASIQGQPTQTCEIEIYDAGHSPHWLKVTGAAIYDGLGHCTGIEGKMHDITSEKQYGKSTASALETRGEHVIKTDLPQSFHRSLQEAIHWADKGGSHFSVILLSLERSRYLDGGLVSKLPDEVLKEAGKRLVASLRDSDKIVEIGADKFGLILPETSDKSAHLIGEKIRKILQVPYLVGVKSIVMDTAIGFASCPDHGGDPESLIKKAQVTVPVNPFESSGKGKPAKKNLSDDASLQLQQDLVCGLDECKVALRSTSQNNIKVLNRHSQFVVYYQSRHSLSDYSINGFEALIRWQHPELGMLLPKDFVDLVKDIGLLDVMTYWIIQQVSFQALDWEKKGIRPGVLAVNLGDLTIKQAVDVKKIAAIVNETGAKPEWLMFSIQEQDLAKNIDLIGSSIQQLTAGGFTVGIDNFRSETMLDSIKALPAQVVEIDPALIRYLARDSGSTNNIGHIMTALHEMGKTILAKEIESEQQLVFLRNNSCDVIQGHLLSRPVPAKEAKELMENLPDFAWYLKQ